MEAELWKNTIYWLVLHDLLSLLPYTIQVHLPRRGTIMPPKACLLASLMKTFSQLNPLFPDKYLCQIKKNITGSPTELYLISMEKPKNWHLQRAVILLSKNYHETRANILEHCVLGCGV